MLYATRVLCLNQLEGHVDFDIVAEDDSTGIGGHVPGQAKFLTVDLAADGQAGAGVTPGVFDDAAEFDFKPDVLCGAADGEVAIYIIRTVVVYIFDSGKNELHLRVVCHVEEIGGFDMTVALFVLGIDGRGVYGERGFCRGKIVAFGSDVGGEGGEGAGHCRDHQVLYFEFDFRVSGVQYPFRCSHKDLF
jgi:hypothetical protein